MGQSDCFSSRWFILSSCLMIAGICGLVTAFGLISPALESELDYSASEIALVASFGNLGTFSGFLAGLMIERFGPMRAVHIGSCFIWFGLFFIWISVEKLISSSVGSLCLYIYVAQLGSAVMSQASSSTSMLIMPSSAHGEIASIAKAYYGIAGGVLSSIAGTYFADNDKGFILFASIIMPMVTAFGGSWLRLLPEELISFNEEKKNSIRTTLVPYYYHFLILIALIIITAALYLTDSGGPEPGMIFGTFVLLWLFLIIFMKPLFYYPNSAVESSSGGEDPIADGRASDASGLKTSRVSLVLQAEVANYEAHAEAILDHQDKKRDSTTERRMEMRNSNSLTTSILEADRNGSDSHSVVSAHRLTMVCAVKPNPEEDLTLWQMLQTGRFYATFFIQATHYGGTLLLINLIEPIATSHGVEAGAFLVLLISISSAFGRISIGYIAQRFQDSVSLVGWMGYANLSVCIVNLTLAMYIRSEYLFYFLVLCTGALYGTMTVLSAAIVVSLFGVTYVATNDGMYDLSGAVGSYAIAFGAVAMFPPRTNRDDDDGGCVGAHCYQEAFFFSSAFCFLGFVLAVLTDSYLKKHNLIRQPVDCS